MNLYTKQKWIHRHKKQIYGHQRGREGEDKFGVWDQQIYTTIYKINNKDLLYSTGNYIQHLIKTYNGKESEKVLYIYKTESLCCTPELTQQCKSTIFQFFKNLKFF